jgi:hypothetical protein
MFGTTCLKTKRIAAEKNTEENNNQKKKKFNKNRGPTWKPCYVASGGQQLRLRRKKQNKKKKFMAGCGSKEH